MVFTLFSYETSRADWMDCTSTPLLNTPALGGPQWRNLHTHTHPWTVGFSHQRWLVEQHFSPPFPLLQPRKPLQHFFFKKTQPGTASPGQEQSHQKASNDDLPWVYWSSCQQPKSSQRRGPPDGFQKVVGATFPKNNGLWGAKPTKGEITG